MLGYTLHRWPGFFFELGHRQPTLCGSARHLENGLSTSPILVAWMVIDLFSGPPTSPISPVCAKELGVKSVKTSCHIILLSWLENSISITNRFPSHCKTLLVDSKLQPAGPESLRAYSSVCHPSNRGPFCLYFLA